MLPTYLVIASLSFVYRIMGWRNQFRARPYVHAKCTRADPVDAKREPGI